MFYINKKLYNIESYTIYSNHHQNDGVLIFLKEELNVLFEHQKLFESDVSLARVTFI